MTAQIPEIFRYQAGKYELVGISDKGLFDPSVFDLEFSSPNTACYRGFQAVFALEKDQLVIREFRACLADLFDSETSAELTDNRFEIAGTTPSEPPERARGFNAYYKNLNYELNYTGGLLLGDEFIRDLYTHMGFQAPWKYEKVIELIFEEGVLQKETDRSERMSALRDEKLSRSQGARAPEEEIPVIPFIRDSFDLSYGFEDNFESD